MAALGKQETASAITYTVSGPSGTSTVTIEKDDKALRMTLVVPWPINDCAGWRDYCVAAEQGATVVEA